MTFNQQLIAKARKGEIAILNDGSVEELNQVLKQCWPKDGQKAAGSSKYYEKMNDRKWGGMEYTDVPAHSVKDFFMTDTKDKAIEELKSDLEWMDKKKEQPRTYRVTRSQMKEIYDSIEKPSHQVVIDLIMKDNFPTYENEAIFSDGHVSMLKSVSIDIDVLKKIFPEYFFIPEGEPCLVRTSGAKSWLPRISDGKGGAYNEIDHEFGAFSLPYNEIIPFTKNPPK